MIIELRRFEGCPSWEDGLLNLKQALAEEGITAEVRVVLVETDEDAQRLQFLGSPSFIVDGKDLWPEQRERYSLSCRVYETPQGLRGVPTVGMLRVRLRQRLIGKG